MIYLGADGYLYDTNDFRNDFRNFTVYDEGAGGGQTVEIIGQRDITPDLAAEYARQLQLSQERGQIIGYTPTGEPIYNVVSGNWPPTPGAENTVVISATTSPTTTDETENTGLQTGASGFLGGTPIGTGTTGLGEGAGTGATDAGTGAGAGGTGADTGTGGTGMGTGTGAGTGIGDGLLGTSTVTGTGGADTLVGATTNDVIDNTVFPPEIVITPEGPVVLPPVLPPVVLPPVVPPVVPPVTQPPVVQPPVTQPPVTNPAAAQQEMMRYGGFNFFNTPLQSGFYSERGFEPGYLPFGPGYPTFRSGVSGYTPMAPTGFEFGIPEVFAPRVVFQPGVFDPGVIGQDGTWRPTPSPAQIEADKAGSIDSSEYDG